MASAAFSGWAPRAMSVLLIVLCGSGCTRGAGSRERHVSRADALAAQGNHLDAILEYRNALKADPRDGEVRIKLADAYLATNNLPAAGQEFIRAADLMPHRADVQMKAATVMLSVKEFESARKYSDLALQVDSKHVEAYIVRALAMAGLGDLGGALRDLQAAIIADPADARPVTTIGAIRALNADHREAEGAFRKAVAIDPKSMNARAALGFYLWAVGRSLQARQVFAEALVIEPADPIVNRLLALLNLTDGREADAEPLLKRLVSAGDESAVITLGDVYVRTNRPNLARQQYAALGAGSAHRPTAVARLAALDYAEGRRAESWESIEAGLKEFPNSSSLWIMKTRWLLTERRTSEAVDAAKRAVVADPASARARLVLGAAHSGNGDDQDAIAAFREALRLNPRMSTADSELSRLLLRQGDRAQSVQHAMSARSSRPREYRARLAFARAVVAGDAARARVELKELLADYPNSASVHSLYAQALQASGDTATAVRHLDTALKLDPADVPALTARVGLDLRQKRVDDARRRIAAALERQGDRAAVLIVAAEFEHALGDAAAAEKYLRRAIESEPTNVSGYAQLAHLFVSINQAGTGKQEMLSFLKRRPDSVPARTLVAMIDEMEGRHESAIELYESIVSTSDRAPVAANNLAFLYLERDMRLERALQLAESARAQLPGELHVRDTLGWAYFKNGMILEAVRELEAIVEAAPGNASYLAHLGFAYETAGRSEKARDAFERALQLNPNLRAADEIRSRLALLKNRTS